MKGNIKKWDEGVKKDGCVTQQQILDSGNNDTSDISKVLHIDFVSDAVCHYWHCLDQYKEKCTNGSYWKTCKNRQTER